MKSNKLSPVMLMALTVLIDFTGFGIIIPLLPFWAKHLGANATQVGLILTAYSLAQFIFLPVLGRLSDRFGRRPVILWSLVIEAISFVFSALAGTFFLLLVARFIGGLGGANLGSAQAVVSDTTTPEDRAKGMGMIGAAIGVGFVVGPAIGGPLSALGFAVPFWVAAGVALVNLALVFFFLPETRNSQVSASKAHALSPLAGLGATLRQPVILRLLGISLFYSLAFTAMEAMYPLFSQHIFGWGAEQNAYIFVYVGVLMVIVQGGLVGRLAKRFGSQALLIAGLALLAVGLLALTFSVNLTLMLVAVGLLSIGSGAVSTTSSALASLAVDSESQGQTLSVIQSIGGLGRVLAPIGAGWLYQVASAGAPFFAGGLLVVVALFIALPAIPLRQRVAQPASVA